MPKRKYNGDPPGKKIFMLHDTSNGNPGTNNYCWWFETLAQAKEHKKWSNSFPDHAQLIGPFEYRRVQKRKKS